MPLLKSAAVLAVAGVTLVKSATVTHDFNITWVTANPDGAMERPVIGINGQWPIPRLEIDIGDRLVINVNNQLGNQSTSLHFHGLFQNGTNQMDGPAGVTQCPIPPGSSFTYNFTVSYFKFTTPETPTLTAVIKGRPTRHVLVSLPHKRSISRRPTRSSYRQ